jgi:hypothetical protein
MSRTPARRKSSNAVQKIRNKFEVARQPAVAAP